MTLPVGQRPEYQAILDALKEGPSTLQTLDNEARICLTARGLIKFDNGMYRRDEDAIDRDRSMTR